MSLFRRIYALLKPSERQAAAALLALMVVGMLLETLGVGIVIPAVALLMQENIAATYPQLRPLLQTLGSPSPARLAAWGMIALVGLYLVKAVFLAYLTWMQTRFAYRLQARLSRALFETYLRQPYTFHLQRNSAQLIRNALTEVSLVTSSAVSPAMVVLTEALVVAGVAALLLAVEPVGALIVVAVLGLAAFAFQRATRERIARWGRARQHHDGLRVQHIQQGLGAAKDVKLLGREQEFLAEYDVHNAQTAAMARNQTTLQQLPRLWLELLAVAGLATLVVTMLAQGQTVRTIMPTLGVFAAAAFRLMPSVNRLIGALQQIRYGSPAVDIVHEELRLPGDPPTTAVRTPTSPFESAVELRNVAYQYPSTRAPALRGVTLAIRKGESVGFVGPSGSGKSTIVDVILGLLTPTEGTVAVDGRNIHDDPRNWQDQIGYVSQTIFLTDDSIRRNVAFGVRADVIDDAAVQRAIRAAQLEEFIASLPEGLDTLVGERGVRLSGGQRQRIGIARALYHDPAVLVLDEATSALDLETERGVMESVDALHGVKTLLIVAHRLSTVSRCDRLYRLENGRVRPEIPATKSASA